MRKISSYLTTMLLVCCLAALTACGGGGGSSAPSPDPAPTPTPAPVQQTRALLKLSATGANNVALTGAGVSIILPAGVTPQLTDSGDVDSSVVLVSGVAAPGTAIAGYNPATATDKGRLFLAVASSIPAGFYSGEYATVTLQIAQGTTVDQNDFSLTGFSAISTTGDTVPGYTGSFTATFP